MARPRDPSIDRKIIDACLELLAQQGRVGLTRERIATRAGVSLPAVTRRYDSVDAILRGIARTPYHETPTLPEIGSLREYLVASLTRTVETLQADPTIARSAVELLAAGAADDEIAEELRVSMQNLRAQGRYWIEQAKITGEVAAEVDAELLLDLLASATYYPLLWRGEKVTVEQVEPIVDVLLRGAWGARRSTSAP